LATQLCANAKSDREKIDLLSREVQKSIGYKAIEFGVRARRPNAAADTLRQRYGDCKDHALLLHQLLRAAKVESHLALVNTDYRINPDLPSLDQFNHMVVHVPALGKGWLIDPTSKHMSLTGFVAGGIWDSHALLLDPANPRLAQPLAGPRPGSSDVESHRIVKLVGRDWEVTETLTLSGYYAASIRASYGDQTNAEQMRRAQSTLSDAGTAEIKEFKFENLDDLSQPARISMTYAVRNAVKIDHGKATAPLPAFWEKEYLGLSYVANRSTPFRFRYPFHFRSSVALEVAPDVSFASLADHGSGKFAKWQLQPSSTGTKGKCTAEFDFQAEVGQWPAQEYAKLYDAWDSARRAWDRAVEWRVRE
jgi:hypothetical protein